jgi:hypothetical protein
MQPMAGPHLRLIHDGDAIPQRREFDCLGQVSLPRIVAQRVELEEIPELLALAANEIPALAAASTAVARVAARNCDSVWVFRRATTPVGIYAMLHLSKDGLEALLLGELNTSFPEAHCLVPTGEAPAAIYKWAVVAPGMASAGICAISRMLQSDLYANANLFARPTTMGGERIMASLGFRKVRSGLDDLHRYIRLANRTDHLVEAV